ncbi:hypothetical protein OG765_00105 [Streptomyces sp. NBC_00555]|uniref:hypothetical protein n=1 Tax=Streptomyces sp. NBC_00555 TaxID=2903662 RepID=UPI002250456F|nr:hypothetical protein [Streptomyces sp. NBC_00555]MCX5009424.1 hypothetical protein [Streptomyces sp. NBC_00555]
MVDGAFRALGAAHEGSVGVLLEDGTEPGPVYYDVGSGGHVPSATMWHAYDGRYGRPRAAVLRGACSCGWRGAAEYPLNWELLGDQQPLYEADVDISGPIADYGAHLSVVKEAAVALPADLTALLTELTGRLADLAVQEPLVALKALADLQYVTAQTGADATRAVLGGRVPIGEVATALGTSEAAARTYVTGYLHP